MNIMGTGDRESWVFVIEADHCTKIEEFMKENGIRFERVTSCAPYKGTLLAVYTVKSRDTIIPTITVVRNEIEHLEQNG